MKRISFLIGSVFLSVSAMAAGPYEMGRLEVGGVTCQWTTPVKKSCYQADMARTQPKFMNCFDSKVNRAERCKDEACVQRIITESASACCKQTRGQIIGE